MYLAWDGDDFKDLAYTPDGIDWVTIDDEVIAWMYLPDVYTG